MSVSEIESPGGSPRPTHEVDDRGTAPEGDDGQAGRWTRLVLGVATAAATALALAMLATWVPHYLNWPWWADLDTYAAIAQGWDRGVRPYRDVIVFNFPGQIYVFWALGKLFGWGKTAPIHAVDAGLLVLVGVAMVAWSRRRLGGALPGLIGFLALLGYYLRIDYQMVAQRDWHASSLVVLALMALEAAGPRRGLILSALAFAAAAAFRPHVVLFLPAAVLALDERSRPEGGPWSSTARATVAWGALLAAFVALALLPLIASGLIPGLLRGIWFARHSGPYARRTGGKVLELVADLRDGTLLLTAAAVVALAVGAAPAARRAATTWLVAFVTAMAYVVIHPTFHAYLVIPLHLIWAFLVAFLAAFVRDRLRGEPGRLGLALLALIVVAVNHEQLRCSARASLKALGELSRGEMPAELPPGVSPARWDPARLGYSWSDYRSLLAYLRERTGPETPVANALKGLSYPAMNGPTGRVTPWPTEGGIPFLRLVDLGREPDFARAVEAAPPGAVVVWIPDEVPDPLPNRPFETPALDRAIRENYRPEAKFGALEVWRRIGDDAGAAPLPAPRDEGAPKP